MPPALRRAIAVGLGVVLIILGLLDWHVQVGQIILGAILVGGGTVASIVELIRGPQRAADDPASPPTTGPR